MVHCVDSDGFPVAKKYTAGAGCIDTLLNHTEQDQCSLKFAMVIGSCRVCIKT